MDEFENPARRRSGNHSVLTALLIGALCGGGLGLQSSSLEDLTSDVRQVLGAPALGGPKDQSPEWTPREDPEQDRADLQHDLTDSWPADRMLVVAEPVGAPAAARVAAPAAAPARPAEAPFVSALPPDWRRHLIPVWQALPQGVRSSAEIAAAAIQAAAAPPASGGTLVASAQRPAGVRAASIHYAQTARSAVLSAGGTSAMNFTGGRLR